MDQRRSHLSRPAMAIYRTVSSTAAVFPDGRGVRLVADLVPSPPAMSIPGSVGPDGGPTGGDDPIGRQVQPLGAGPSNTSLPE